jgi:hypothetical protein
VAQERPRGHAPLRRLTPRLPERLGQRRAVGDRGDAEHDPAGQVVADRAAVHELVDGEADRQAAADQERRDRREERPDEPRAAMAERVLGIGRPAGAPQRHREHDLVRGVGDGMCGLGEQRGRPGQQAGRQLRDGDHHVGGERNGDAAAVALAAVGAERRRRVA